MSGSEVRFTVNGQACTATPRPGLTLLGQLRGPLGLTGAKLGCAAGACGACTVVMDGVAVQSCQVPLSAVEGATVQTVEGLRETPLGRRVTEELIAAGAAQCGYCLPGIVASATAAFAAGEATPEAALERNLCRCGTHLRILTALRQVAVDLQESEA